MIQRLSNKHLPAILRSFEIFIKYFFLTPQMFTGELKDSQKALSGSQALGLNELIHPPGCSDPNCLLPSCINIKLRKNHLQTCRKKKGRCDICKILTSNLTSGLASPFPEPPALPPPRRKLGGTAATQGDANVSARNGQKKILPEPKFVNVRKETASFDCLKKIPAPRYESLSMAILPYVDRSSSFQPQGQNTVQHSTNLNGNCKSIQALQEQAIQQPLEVLCNALQGLNTVIQMVTSNQLEIEAIPIFKQALASMESTVSKRSKGNVITRSFDNPRPMMMDCFENGTVKVENQWGTPVAEADIPMLQSTSLPASFIIPSSSTSPTPLSASSSSSSSSLSSTPPVTPSLCDDVLPDANLMAGCFQVQQTPSKPMLTKESVKDVGGHDLMNEFSFDLQDIILLDFAEELLE